MRRVHPLTCPVAPHDLKRQPKLHARRDLCAGIELEHALFELGFRHGEQILHQPPRGAQEPPPGELFHVDLSFVDSSDLLLQFTRPPLDDIEQGSLRKIPLARTDLERDLFELWRHYLSICARNHVVLHPDFHALVRPGFEECREMTFKQKGWGGPYDERNARMGQGWRKVRGKRRTAVFLLRVEHAWEGGPGYLGAFGVDGCGTTVWSYRLARDLRPLLETPGFVVAELELGRIPDHPTDLRWCMDWPIEVVLEHRFDASPIALAAT